MIVVQSYTQAITILEDYVPIRTAFPPSLSSDPVYGLD